MMEVCRHNMGEVAHDCRGNPLKCVHCRCRHSLLQPLTLLPPLRRRRCRRRPPPIRACAPAASPARAPTWASPTINLRCQSTSPKSRAEAVAAAHGVLAYMCVGPLPLLCRAVSASRCTSERIIGALAATRCAHPWIAPRSVSVLQCAVLCTHCVCAEPLPERPTALLQTTHNHV
jgi:hypothetical protein